MQQRYWGGRMDLIHWKLIHCCLLIVNSAVSCCWCPESDRHTVLKFITVLLKRGKEQQRSSQEIRLASIQKWRAGHLGGREGAAGSSGASRKLIGRQAGSLWRGFKAGPGDLLLTQRAFPRRATGAAYAVGQESEMLLWTLGALWLQCLVLITASSSSEEEDGSSSERDSEEHLGSESAAAPLLFFCFIVFLNNSNDFFPPPLCIKWLNMSVFWHKLNQRFERTEYLATLISILVID